LDRAARRVQNGVRVELIRAEPTADGEELGAGKEAWSRLIELLIDRQMEHVREHHGEAALDELLAAIEAGVVDPLVMVGVVPPDSNPQEPSDDT
jgi:hypothetical protein